ncbi:MarR family winged helix-turn-helix transcriptional regulator (plasmid) [Pantoea dispersa]|uniref:MarR family winged helix-turn-helix transcriptional regulator n=1 Tax=Pantoea TaxID=53335 RepID=UPI0010A82A2A|nr:MULTISPECIES: MarR family winged helix-turn-helix transcriptional regulator [Pantoea]THD40139.1 MarR family transcriptional regulator [Pantoea sp. R102]WEA08225.1 MarR family winged helix-turn-helix transcriptional regulator [Pantoea dispersa]
MSGFDPKYFRDVAAECPGFQARATARAVTRYYNVCFKSLGLTAEQFSLLVGIGAFEGATIVDLAVSAGVDATTLSRNVQNMELRGLVRSEGGRGRAGKRLSLTDSGYQLMAEALPVWKSAKDKLSMKMGDDRLRSATQAMEELARAVNIDQSPEADRNSHHKNTVAE